MLVLAQRAPLCQNTASQSCRCFFLKKKKKASYLFFESIFHLEEKKTGICCNHYISLLRSPWGWTRLMCRHHAHGHEVYTPAHTEADSWSRFVNQVWKKESPLSLWDSHTCCTGLHTENKSAHSSVVTDRTPQKHTQRRSIRGNHTETYSEGGKKKSTQRNADEQMGPQTIPLTPFTLAQSLRNHHWCVAVLI